MDVYPVIGRLDPTDRIRDVNDAVAETGGYLAIRMDNPDIVVHCGNCDWTLALIDTSKLGLNEAKITCRQCGARNLLA